MSKKICFLISGFSLQTHAEGLADLDLPELKMVADLLEKEDKKHNIIFVGDIKDKPFMLKTDNEKHSIIFLKEEKPDLEKLFKMIEDQANKQRPFVLETLPDFPVTPKILLKNNQKKKFFVPRKIGKITSKPKGKFRK